MTYAFDHLTGVLRDGVALPLDVGTSQQCGGHMGASLA